MLDIPGVQELEDKLRLYAPKDAPLPPKIEKMVQNLSMEIFKIRSSEISPEFPDDYELPERGSPEWDRYDDHCEEFYEQFETEFIPEDEVVEFLLGFGLDFRDDLGNPLICTELFALQANAAINNFKGELPDAKSISVQRWGKSLEEDARLHLIKKRAR